MVEKGEQKMNMEEKLALSLHRNFLILLGKLPLRQIAIKSLSGLLTEMSEVRILPGEPTPQAFAFNNFRPYPLRSLEFHG
jgi:hypothetical protein